MAEGARLESVYSGNVSGVRIPLTAIFEMRACTKVRALFFIFSTGGMRTPTGVRQLAQPVGQTASLRGGLPRRGERSESIPPHRHIRDESLYEVRALFFIFSAGGMRTPDRGSTTGVASWTDREPAGRLLAGASEASQSPLTAIFKMRACTQVRAFFFIFSAGGAPREKPIPKLILLHPLILFAEVVHQRPDGGQQPAP